MPVDWSRYPANWRTEIRPAPGSLYRPADAQFRAGDPCLGRITL